MKKIVIDYLSSQYRIAVLDDGELIELIVDDKNKKISVGNIYAGLIKRILPSQFAFVDIGDDKNTFLYLNDRKEEQLFKYDENSNKKKLSIKQGQQIIVQVVKESSDLKGAVVSTQLSFTGKYVVMFYNQNSIGISKKIEDEQQKERLRKIAEKCVPENFGLIMRTSCCNAAEDAISQEINELKNKILNIYERGKYIKAPYEIYKEQNEIINLIKDINLSEDFEIVVNDFEQFNAINEQIGFEKKVVFYDSDIPIFSNFFIEKQIEKAIHNKLWLKSGGFIIIEQTEACTVIDVNTGKYTGKTHNQTILKTNEEAAKEIAKQIRLRNISGMIIIDFIDMSDFGDRAFIKKILDDEVKKDRISTTVVGMTELGLMQLTRKKIRKPLNNTLLCSCPYCCGSGMVFNDSFIADKIINQICYIFSDTIYNRVVVSSNSRIIKALKGNNDDYRALEKKYKKEIVLNIIQTQRYDYFTIEKYKV